MTNTTDGMQKITELQKGKDASVLEIKEKWLERDGDVTLRCTVRNSIDNIEYLDRNQITIKVTGEWQQSNV